MAFGHSDGKTLLYCDGKYYDTNYDVLYEMTDYSYSTDGTTKTAVPVTEVKIKDGDFISATNFEGPFTDSDDDSPYYKVSVTVETNGGNTPRTGHLTIINERGEELELEVEQIESQKEVKQEQTNYSKITLPKTGM